MTRRSMPSSFHVNLFALMPVRCLFSACVAVMAGTGEDFGLHPFFMRAATARPEKTSQNIGPRLGHSFPSGLVSETTTQNIGSERDTFSHTGLKRKLHPSLRPQNGMQFPPD